ncbi:amino acid/amide ABC transporter membrane protein 2, HAAT family [Fervidobacterium gondwanense DSM 13020]|uniref:Amino acid/amide ABC transporter membrane protein 2, HAAT family n=2 Tax=Fervidobacterium gondwanense TaxID=44754 RepID=A0A1M7S8F7_FERGO|nr:amino acid/amide ABC transporter membrane protein 2, HAAT family [Fervidobacterium gondwanense DSM 13020]
MMWLWIFLAVLPFLLIKNAFIMTILSLVGIYSIASLGLNLIMGYSGQISIGHAAFMSIGAYTSTLLVMNYNLPIVFGILIGGIVAFLFGLLIGFPALRLSGFYLAIATLGFVVAVEQLFSSLEHLTGGHAGIRNIPFPYLWNSDVEKYLLVLSFLFISYILLQRLINSKNGRAWMAIRENEIASAVMGVNVAKYKVLAFAIGSMLAGIAGALYAHVIGYIAPSDFGIAKSLDLLAISVIGGMASLDGPFYGSLVYTALPFLFSRSHLSLSIVFGIILIFVVLFMPLGVSFYIGKFRTKYLNSIAAYLKKSRKPYGQFLDTKFGKIHYIKSGSGPKNLVLVHGNFASARFFEPLIALIPKNEYTVYALDLPNFGFSEEFEGEVSIEKYADALSAFIEKLGISNIILLGHSLGGAVAMGYAVKNPSKLQKLILVDPAPVYGMPKYDESAYKIIELYRKNPDMIKKALMINAPTYENEKFFKKIMSDALRMARKTFIGNAKALASYNYSEQAKNIEIPVKVVYGDKDVILTLESMEITAKAFKNGELIVLEDIGHSPVVENPGEIIRIIKM